VAIIEETKDQARLDGWLDRFATADRVGLRVNGVSTVNA
jgi:hypothetical protein